MSGSRQCELDAAVHDRLVGCTPAEGLVTIAGFVGTLLATAPGPRRAEARAVFLAMVDRAVTDRLIGTPRGSA